MEHTPLHALFGVQVHDVDLRIITADDGYPEIRALFEEHSVLLFRDQTLSEDEQIKVAQLFGPIEDRSKGADGHDPVMSMVSNIDDDGGLADTESMHLKQLQAKQLWHTDSTFLPVPALINIAAARVLPSSGGETEFVSTRAAWCEMPPELKQQAAGKVFWHSYAQSRRQIDPELAKEDIIAMWNDEAWRSTWTNPVSGEEALYIASHVFAVDGMEPVDGMALVAALIEFATRDGTVYSHQWRLGDVIIWDERATLHRGRAWPYDEARSLSSLCVTARECDGLDSVRP